MRTAILGASGLVGRKILNLLEECTWLQGDPILLTSSRSAGLEIEFKGRVLTCREVSTTEFKELDLAIFSAGGGTSRIWAPIARDAGCVVIDNSSAWRMDPDVPLVVPEINKSEISSQPGIIANPNCSTIQIVMAVAPLDQAVGVKECHVTTLQAVSGAGQAAVQELLDQTKNYPDLLSSGSLFPRPMAFNVLPAIGAKAEGGGYEEETKVLHEMRRILGRGTDLHITCTATRVPVITGHSAAIRVVCGVPITAPEAVEILQKTPGIKVVADAHDFHTAREIAGSNEVFVGRVRQDPGCPNSLLMWVVADNLLKGAAWNAVQIGREIAEVIKP